jgi:hypothetical protein
MPDRACHFAFHPFIGMDRGQRVRVSTCQRWRHARCPEVGLQEGPVLPKCLDTAGVHYSVGPIQTFARYEEGACGSQPVNAQDIGYPPSRGLLVADASMMAAGTVT